MNNKFYVLRYGTRKYWSNELLSYITNDFMPAQVWAHKDKPLRGELVNIHELMDILSIKKDNKKEHRHILMTFESEYFPIKEFTDISKWNGVIKVDFDNNKSPLMQKLTYAEHALLYDTIDDTLQIICPNHYLYIEKSSSLVGWHMMFYFDCEKTEDNYKKCAQFVYEIFRYKIDDYIKDFSHIFTLPECLKNNGESTVFDPVYKRPYQKFYMTGIEKKLHNCDGAMDDVKLIEEIKEYHHEENKADGSFFNVAFNKSSQHYLLDHNDRFYIITALKRYCKDKKTAYQLWYDFCPKLQLYKKYTTKDFIKQFDREYDKAKETAGHIGILEKYGFKVDKSIINYKLENDQYLSDIVNDVLEQCEIGVNLLNVPTGGGKTFTWIDLGDKISNDILNANKKSILVVEPLNSIIQTKYDERKHNIIIKSKQLKESTFTTFNFVVTNYNHLLSKDFESYKVRDDIGKIFSLCDIVIIDESHIMIKDVYRSDVLIEFIETINKYNDKCKIIIQTATPMLEKSLFNIKKTINVHKDLDKKIKYIFRKCENNKFNITDIYCLVNYYNANNRKVYIYWNNGSLQNMKMFQNVFENSVIIYHKRDEGSEDMKWINNEHNLGDVQNIMSSVYFGVGNDLNDDGPTAVIIIGNNVVQEDIQAIGRWRNSKDIEVCQIILPHELEEFESSKNNVVGINELITNRTYYYNYLYHDKYNKDKSVVVGNKSFMLKHEYYCEYLGKMDAANIYYKQAKIKIDYLKSLGYDVRETIKPLKINIDLNEQIKEYKTALKNHRNLIIRKLLNGDDISNEERNANGKIDKVARIIGRLRANDLLDKIKCIDKVTYSRLLRYNTFMQYYSKEKYEKSDYAELFSILWYRDNVDKLKKEKKKYKVMEQHIIAEDYCCLCSYLIWSLYRNKEDSKDMMKLNYFKEFRDKCNDMKVIEDSMIDEIFRKNYYNEEFNEFYKEFFRLNDDNYNNTTNNTKDNLIDYISKINVDEIVKSKIVAMCLQVINPEEYSKIRMKNGNQKGGQKGGQKGTKKVKDMSTGKVYDSKKECANDIGKSTAYITKYKDRFIVIK